MNSVNQFLDSIDDISIIIDDVTVYIYNFKNAKKNLDCIKNKSSNSKNEKKKINLYFMYLLHQRNGNYMNTQTIAFDSVNHFNRLKKNDDQLICITFDLINHGKRLFDPKKNRSWKSGNENHASDIDWIISTTVIDLVKIINEVPKKLSLNEIINQNKKNLNVCKINILSGYSLGAHIAFRFSKSHPEMINILNPVIGTPNLSSLFIYRLLGDKFPIPQIINMEYDQMFKNEEEKKKNYTYSVHNSLKKTDIEFQNSDYLNHLKVFSVFGSKDKLVPQVLSNQWIKQVEKNTESKTFIQDVGHIVTKEMIESFVEWLVDVVI